MNLMSKMVSLIGMNSNKTHPHNFTAAIIVFSSKETIVVRPTPPGTGVIRRLYFDAFLKSISPLIYHQLTDECLHQ